MPVADYQTSTTCTIITMISRGPYQGENYQPENAHGAIAPLRAPDSDAAAS